MTRTKETRAQRQAHLDARVADLRARGNARMAASERLHATVNKDGAFWTQPAYCNAGGRAFASRRDRERRKLEKANRLYAEGKSLLDAADAMTARGVRMAGDAAAEREAVIAAADFKVGQMVSTLYGVRKVVKVNQKSLLVEGAERPLSVPKHLAQAAMSGAGELAARCIDCAENPADVPSNLCPGCEAYREHTGVI